MNIKRSLITFITGLVIAFIGIPLNVSAQTSADNYVQSDSARSAFLNGNYGEAERRFREAVRNAEAENATPGRMATELGNLAQVLSTLGRFKEAEELFDRALKVEASANVEPRVRTILLMNLSSLYTNTDRLSRAESLLDEVVVLCRKHFGADSKELAAALKRQGIVYAMTKRLGRAEDRLKEALAIAEKQPELPSAELSTILTTLAGIYSLQKKWSRAEPLYLQAVDIFERTKGPVHPGISDIMINVGEQRIHQGDFVGAEAALRRALAIKQAVFGWDHVDAARIATRLAGVLTALKKNDEAYGMFASFLPVQERFRGSDDPELASALEQFGRLLRQMQRPSQAETIEARARSIRETLSYTVSADQLLK